jgi:hypothetical protein
MRDRSLVQLAALVVGATFLLVAVLGFVPGITTDYRELSFAGQESEAELLGLFQVSVLHNIVHGLFGLAGIASARTISGARAYLLGGGVISISSSPRTERSSTSTARRTSCRSTSPTISSTSVSASA